MNSHDKITFLVVLGLLVLCFGIVGGVYLVPPTPERVKLTEVVTVVVSGLIGYLGGKMGNNTSGGGHV